MSARLLRAVALAIVLAAIVDPAITRERPVAPLVALAVSAGADDLAERVVAALAPDYVVSSGPTAGAAARVVVGDALPEAGAVPTFVVLDREAADRAVILSVRAPERAPLHGRVPVTVQLRAGTADPGAAVELIVDGLVADRRPLAGAPRGARGMTEMTLSFTPAAARPHRVTVALAEARAETLVSIDETPWRVLVYDARPSWASTFVRRALQGDPRFAVAARVDTAPRARVAAGDAPALTDAVARDTFDVIVAGAPEALDGAAVRALDDFLRRRGGSVLLLIDGEPGAAAELSGARDWRERLSPAPVQLVGNDGGPRLRASELSVPSLLPAGSRMLAAPGEAPEAPAVWRIPVGRGRLVVSGALDAWRFRGDETRFDAFWRDVTAAAAAAAPAPVEIRVSPRVARPGDTVEVEVSVRDLALAHSDSASARAGAWLRAADGDPAGGGEPVRLWPTTVGKFRARARLPETPGTYRIEVEAGGTRAAADLLVAADAAPAGGSAPDVLEAWAAAQGGAVFSAERLPELRAALATSLESGSETGTAHPMRSGWWIVPLALALGGEWWLRRRRGLR